LRIFLCCQQAMQRHAVPAYEFWAGYFRCGLAEAGHSTIEAPDCDWAEGLLPLEKSAAHAWRERTWGRAVDFLRREHARQPVDFFLSYLFPSQVLPSGVAEIRALGISCVNFFCDNVREFRRVPDAFHCFDLHWVPEHKGIPLYQHAGLAWLHAPMPCWVPPAWRTPVTTETHPVTFIGTRDEQREALFSSALARGLAIELRGTGWAETDPPAAPPAPAAGPGARLANQVEFARKHGLGALARKYAGTLGRSKTQAFDFSAQARPAPTGDNYWRILRGSTVCIGVNRYPSLRRPFKNPGTYSRLRDIEAPMTGACYLTEWTEGLDQLYHLGSEIETYRDAGELAEKARVLADDPPRRERLRAAGQQRALNDHSISRTIQLIAERLNLPQTAPTDKLHQ
jgi:hypothetical protein